MVPATAQPPAGPYDLTTLEIAKSELSIASGDLSRDAFISRAITQASLAIGSYCDRVFQAEVVQDQFFLEQYAYPWQIPGGICELPLSRWPLPVSGVVTFTGNGNASSVVTKVSSTAGVVLGTPIFASDGSVPPGTTIQGVTPSSVQLSGPTTSKAVGLTFTAGMQVVQTLSAGVTQTLVFGSDFTLDAKKGFLVRLDSFTGQKVRWEALPTTVQYLGGYQTIPADLVDACLRLVTMRVALRGRDPTLVERTQANLVGTERYWVGPVAGQKTSLPPEIALLVDHYRTPVVG
ncbi:MAG: hypothetical protein ACP5P4_08060 [Steroidobacteraceae bacterium]